jgi:hypothetical protein
LLQVLFLCLVTVLLSTLINSRSQCSGDPKQLRLRRNSKALPLKDHSTVHQHTAAVAVKLVVPDVSSYTADVLPKVAEAVAQLEQQGQGRKVIAVSLYGKNPRYLQGAVENAMLAKRDWPGWTYRVYYGKGVPADVLRTIEVRHSSLESS